MFLKKILITIVSLFSFIILFNVNINASDDDIIIDNISFVNKYRIDGYDYYDLVYNDLFFVDDFSIITDTNRSLQHFFNIGVTVAYQFQKFEYYIDLGYVGQVVLVNNASGSPDILEVWESSQYIHFYLDDSITDTYYIEVQNHSVSVDFVEIHDNPTPYLMFRFPVGTIVEEKLFSFLNEFFDFVNAPFQTILEHLGIANNSFSLGLGQVQFFEVTIGQFSYWSFSFLIVFLIFRFIYRLLRKLMRAIFGGERK